MNVYSKQRTMKLFSLLNQEKLSCWLNTTKNRKVPSSRQCTTELSLFFNCSMARWHRINGRAGWSHKQAPYTKQRSFQGNKLIPTEKSNWFEKTLLGSHHEAAVVGQNQSKCEFYVWNGKSKISLQIIASNISESSNYFILMQDTIYVVVNSRPILKSLWTFTKWHVMHQMC